MSKNTLKAIIYTGLFIIPFIPFFVFGSFFFPFITTKAFVFRIIVEIIFAAWIILAVKNQEFRPRKSLISYALLAFLLVIGLADIFGAAPSKSLWSNFERMEGYVSLIHFGMLYLVMSSFLREVDWKRWWNTNLAASFVMVLYCSLQLAGVYEIHQGGARVDGTLGNAAYLAVYMLVNIFIALLMFVRANDKGKRWIYGCLMVLQIWTLYHTATRGAILGLLGGLVVMSLLSFRQKESPIIRKLSRGVLVGVVILVIGFFALKDSALVKNSPVLERFANISSQEIKSGGRSFVWPMALKGVAERPILGWGQENFNYVFNEHYDSRMFALEPWFDRAHNIFLDWATAGGTLGLLAYLSLYVSILFLIWKSANFSHIDKAVLTGLMAAYFFHNLFVFDQLVSYIFFISMLAYVHNNSFKEDKLGGKEFKVNSAALYGGVLVAMAIVLYFFSIKPISANANLISAIKNAQIGSKKGAIEDFKSAYSGSRLGRPEVVEQMVANAENILGDTSLSMDEKNDYFLFVKDALFKINEELPLDARYQILAGSYFAKTGQKELASQYLAQALELMPEKQMIYFEYGSALLNAGDARGALEQFRKAYELAPEYLESKIVYLAGSILVGDRSTEERLKLQIPHDRYVLDDRIASSLLQANRYGELEAILKERIQINPKDPNQYISLAVIYVKAGEKGKAIDVLRSMSANIPEQKSNADAYIKGIEDGTIK